MSDVLTSLREGLSGRYEIERELGRGGMATVWLARDVRHGRPVAVKVLHPDLAAAMGAERFLREIQLAAQLRHPHILPLYDSGEAGGHLYYVMPFVEGEALRARLGREKLLPVAEAVRLACEVASGLDYAHRRGVVHRDIKPENILLEDGHAIVADFGIARAVSQAAEGESLTLTGMSLGTPAYMSPEQAAGEREIDGRSDQYSLACVLYEMLLGQPPFVAPSAQALMARHALDPVPRLTTVRSTISDELERVVLRGLAKVPADRFPTVAHFAEALAGCTPTVDERPLPLLTKRTHRPRRLAVLGTAMLAAALAAWAVWQQGERPDRDIALGAVEGAFALDPRRVAVLYFTDLSRDSGLVHLADGLTEELIDQLQRVRALDVVSANGVRPYRHLDAPRDSIARLLKAGTLVLGTVQRRGDLVRVEAQFADGPSGATFDRTVFERPAGDLLALRNSLGESVARFLRARLGQEIRLREQRGETKNVAAWTMLQRAEKAKKDAEALLLAHDSDGARSAFALADSLLAQAEALDPGWEDPSVSRAALAYRRARLEADPHAAEPIIAAGLGHAARVLTLSPGSADGLELRGTLRYLRHLLHLEHDQRAAAALLDSAERDLRAAVRASPAQAGAWNVLSHLHFLRSDIAAGQVAAQRAYEEDAYLASAPEILVRLFSGSYELEQFRDAAHWCGEGRRRFPADRRFVRCQLLMLTAPTSSPKVDEGWRLLRELQPLVPAHEWEYQKREAQMVIAALAARARLPDSARHLVERSRGDAHVDPGHELLGYEAFVHILLGDKDQALQLLERYLAANPEHRAGLARFQSWWWRELKGDPRFAQMIASGS